MIPIDTLPVLENGRIINKFSATNFPGKEFNTKKQAKKYASQQAAKQRNG